MHDTGEPQESHNKIPKGWLLFFFGILAWLIWYIVSFTPALSGWSFYTKFEKEMASSAPKTADSDSPGRYVGDAKAEIEGATIYASSCSACHKPDGTGGIGPSLKGALKYGSTPKDVYTSIASGRPNGMPPFLPQLGSDKIARLVAYLESLRK